jgi:transcriptional regulator GlxA family with amidase domain
MRRIVGLFIFCIAMIACSEKPKSDIPTSNETPALNDSTNKIVVLLYEGFTMLDVIGPTQSLGLLENVEIITVAKEKGLITSDNGLKLNASHSLDEITSAYILVIPGGLEGTIKASKDTSITNWIKRIDKSTAYTTSVCTGAWILSSTGLMEGKNMATHWYGKEILESKGAIFSPDRYVFDGKYATSAGVSAGIDLGLALVGKISGKEYAEAVQLGLQYDPKPPYNSGTPETADTAITSMMREMYDYAIQNIR